MPMPTPRPYRVGIAPAPGEHLLARLRFGLGHAVSDDPRQITVALPQLAGPSDEFWLSPSPVEHGWQDGIGYAENGEVLFGQLLAPEAQIAQLGLDRVVFHAYARINHLLHSRGYPQWLRMWNYLERITEGEGEAERYRIFNAGRAKALALKPEFALQPPAATAIGSPEGGLLIYFIGARTACGQQVENPRQVPAYHYPRQYGTKSPSFSRASRIEWRQGSDLLVSGTASVVGHETFHIGDLRAQLQETLTNIDCLLAEAQGQRGAAGSAPYRAAQLKLYLSQPEHLPTLLPLVRERLGDCPLYALSGQVCRRDLLVEIEGIFCSP